MESPPDDIVINMDISIQSKVGGGTNAYQKISISDTKYPYFIYHCQEYNNNKYCVGANKINFAITTCFS